MRFHTTRAATWMLAGYIVAITAANLMQKPLTAAHAR
jgi:hypothetical protein